MTGPALPGGTVLIDGEKIVAVGERVAVPADAAVIDAAGKFVTPGLIDAHTHLGVYNEAYVWAGDEVNEISCPTTPEMAVIDAINPDDVGLADAVAGGITTVMVAPGSANPVGGQCSIIKTRRRPSVEAMILRRHAGLKIAFGENPLRVYGEQKKAPVTRMATAALVRATLLKAKDYLARAGEKDWKFDLGLEAVGRVLKREMPLRAHAHRADDIVTALRIADEFGADIIVEHATEGHLIPELLAARRAKVVVGPHLTTRSKIELKASSYAAPAILAAHGVSFALMSDHPVLPSAFLPVYAGVAVRFGLPEDQALRAITADAADILGVGDRIGRLAPGKDADVAVWDGPPLAVASRPLLVLLDGAVGEVGAAQTIAWQE
jgi:Imidazolonepropionase and related amidohydrolases